MPACEISWCSRLPRDVLDRDDAAGQVEDCIRPDLETDLGGKLGKVRK